MTDANPDSKRFQVASILTWCRIAEEVGVPYIPVNPVASVPMTAIWKAIDTPELLTPDESAALAAATAVGKSGRFWRTEFCASMDVKWSRSVNKPVIDADDLMFCVDDPRIIDMHYGMPAVTLIERPMMTPVRFAEWPVEFRVFIGGRTDGDAVSFYYPQAGVFRPTDPLEVAMSEALLLGQRLDKQRRRSGMVPVIGSRVGEQIGVTLDFMLTTERGLVLVDAGPGFGYGAHPCCFIDQPIIGRRWHLAHGVQLR